MFRSLVFFILLFTAFNGFAQDATGQVDFFATRGTPLLEVLSNIEKNSHYKFYYLEEWLSPFAITQDWQGNNPEVLLDFVLMDAEVNFVLFNDYMIIFYKDPKGELERNAMKEQAIDRRVKVDEIAIGSIGSFVPGTQVVLSGTIKDKETDAPLVGATIFVNGLGLGTQTDERGRYQLALPGGEYVLDYRYINYEERVVSLSIYENGNVHMLIDEIPTTLEGVIVSDQAIATKRVGLTTIKMIDLARSPSFLGQKDVIRSLQTQTGVTAVSEASTGFNVRGGGVDQNLVLYDGVPIFNTAHAFGFFTSFNSDAIKEVSFYKGGIPAEYGGRVASVLSMTSREGDFKKWNGNAGISFISSNIAIGGPIKKDTSSLFFSLRSTYSDWILNLLQNSYQKIQESSVSFFDGSIKYIHKLPKDARLTVSSYASRDFFKLSNDTINRWQNRALTVRYDGKLNDEIYYSAGAYLGSYAYRISEEDPATAFDLTYKIFYPSLKFDFNRDALHKQSFGLHVTYYNFQPGELQPASGESNIARLRMDNEKSIETAVYFSESFSLGEKITAEAGMRLSMFNRIGSGLVYNYLEGRSPEPRNVIDSVQYKAGELMKTYGGPEPRLSLQYLLGPNASLKLGYNRMYQYVHLISNTAAVTPVDIWQSSNNYFAPQLSDQISLGYFQGSKNNMYEAFVELYVKDMQNILDFKDGANLILNRQLETALLSGRGKAYGVEFSLEKTKGRLIGSINYTYSRSFRQINGIYEVEKINNGDYYPANFDQPNIVNINWRRMLRKNVFFSGAFTYHSGRPVSLPIAAYDINNSPVIDFSERNNYRLPDYHRLDVALIVEGSLKRAKSVRSEWAFSLYNAYGRKNPYSAFFVYNVAGTVKPFQLSLIAVPVPSISYSVKF